MKEGRLAGNLRTRGAILLDNNHSIPIVIINVMCQPTWPQYLNIRPNMLLQRYFKIRLTFKSVDSEESRLPFIMWTGLTQLVDDLNKKNKYSLTPSSPPGRENPVSRLPVDWSCDINSSLGLQSANQPCRLQTSPHQLWVNSLNQSLSDTYKHSHTYTPAHTPTCTHSIGLFLLRILTYWPTLPQKQIIPPIPLTVNAQWREQSFAPSSGCKRDASCQPGWCQRRPSREVGSTSFPPPSPHHGNSWKPCGEPGLPHSLAVTGQPAS